MALFRTTDRVRVVPRDEDGRSNWARALGGLDKTFAVKSQIGTDVVRVKLEGGKTVEVPYSIVEKA